MRRRLLGAVLAAALAAAGASRAGNVRILAPADGARVPAKGVWLVVEAPRAPSVTLDGRDVPVGPSDDGVHHARIGPVSAEGSRVEVAIPGERVILRLLGKVGDAPGFHGAAPPRCWACHDRGPDGCAECHGWGQGSHGPVLARGCVGCHRAPDWAVPDPEGVCTGCHQAYEGKHRRVRHPLRGSRDPSRPGRALTCVSCHDPHEPRCLSCLGRPALRDWCRRCHGTPG